MSKKLGFGQAWRLLTRRLPFLYRVRYALITELGGANFTRPPAHTSHAPHRIPAPFQDQVSRLKLAGDGSFEDVKKIAFDLSYGHRRGPGLGTPSVETLRRIYSEKAGVCSDYSQVFLGLCEAAGIEAREWGVCASFEGQGVGHTFAEVYSERFRKWIFLDPLYSIFATHRGASTPLAATELIDLATSNQSDCIEPQIIEPDGPNAAKRDVYVDRYLQPDHIFFLLGNNDVFEQDRFLRWSGAIPPPILHMAMIIAGSYQRFHVYANAHNRTLMNQRVGELRKWRVRNVVLPLGAAAAALFAFVSLVVSRKG